MKTLLSDTLALRTAITAVGSTSSRYIADEESCLCMDDLVSGSALFGRGDELSERSVLVAMKDQLATASVLIELDGIARRIVLCPPDLPIEHFPYVIRTAGIDAIVSDRNGYSMETAGPMYFSPCSRKLIPADHNGDPIHQTEWVLLTSGTTGQPKLVAHTLATLAGAIQRGSSEKPIIWSTFYDIRRYGGLQILLRALLTGASLVFSGSHEPTSDFIARAASRGVTHISGTPSQWRRALMSSSASLLKPEYVRLSGEVVDQAVLDKVRSTYPDAQIVHAFASTEAGVGFEVKDELAGFSVAALSTTPGVEMKIEEGTLHIRSRRCADRYLAEHAPQLKDADGFVNTGDIIELRGERCYFAGRRDGVINVGGLKVFPEEIEAVINSHPEVLMSIVRAKRSPVTGSLVVADVVLQPGTQSSGYEPRAIQEDILLLCRQTLSAYKIPAAINIVPSLAVGESGKLTRAHA